MKLSILKNNKELKRFWFIVGLLFFPAQVFAIETLTVGSTFTPNPTPALQKPVLKAYSIKKRDTLWDLAGEFYGKPWVWPLFLKFNSIKNPDLIHPGETLLFPNLKVLMEIKEKSPEQVKKVRQELEKQGPPQVVTQPGPINSETPVPKTMTPTSTPSPSLTTRETPTFRVTGSKSINISYAEAIGNSTNGLTDTGYNRHETLRLHMEGQMNNEVKISGDFNQSDLALEDDYDLVLSTKHWEFYFGDFPATLPGSQFLSSNMQITGLRTTGKYDDWTATAIYGTPKGNPVYQKLFGNGTLGPYAIAGAPFVPSSEVVMLNKQRLSRGTDYTFDYTLGYLTFINRMIQLTDLIEVQAESGAAVYNTQVYGYHAELALAGKLNPSDYLSPTAKSGIGTAPVTSQGILGGPATVGTAGFGNAGGMPVSSPWRSSELNSHWKFPTPGVSVTVTASVPATLPQPKMEPTGNTVPAGTGSMGVPSRLGSQLQAPPKSRDCDKRISMGGWAGLHGSSPTTRF